MRGTRYGGLVLLTVYGIKGRFRQIGRAFRTVRGVIAFLFGFLMFASWFGFSIFGFLSGTRSNSNAEIFETVPLERIRIYIALLLLGYCLITFFFRKQGAGVQFKPAEVDFLFGGPFDRRELLLYKIASLFGSVLMSALIFSLFLAWTPVPWPILFLGVWLAIAFAILLNVLASVASLAFAARLHGKAVRVAAAGVTILFVAVAYGAMSSSGVGSVAERGLDVARSPAGQVLLAPFMVFASAVTALSYTSFALHASLAIGINVCIVAGILMLDADYYESSIDAARKTYERLQRMRQGDLFGADVKRTAAWSLPELPRLAGVGPVAWRQTVTALRSLPRIMLLLLLFIVPGTMFAIGGENHHILHGVLGYLAAMLFVFMPSAFRFDFRSDLNKMSWLKALPVASWAVVVGQLLPAVCMLVVAESLLIAVIATSAARWHYMAVLPLLPGAAFVMFAIENAIFLYFPTRRFAMYPGDFQNLGYTYLVAFAKIMVLGVVFGVIVAIGALLHYVLLVPLPAVMVIAAIILAGFAVAFIPVLTHAYNRFDPSTDVPLD